MIWKKNSNGQTADGRTARQTDHYRALNRHVASWGRNTIPLTSIYFTFTVNFFPFTSICYMLPKSGDGGTPCLFILNL